MNKKQKKLFREIAHLFNVIGSEENLILFYQICEKPRQAKDLETELSRMPLNRRLNILAAAGLIERVNLIKGSNILENRITKLAKPLQKLLLGIKV